MQCCNEPDCRVMASACSATRWATRPVSSASWVMLSIYCATCWVPDAACSALRAISLVAAPCSCTAAAMVEVASLSRPMMVAMWRMASTASPVADCTALTWTEISSVALAV